MDAHIFHSRSQSLLKQRNLLLIVVASLGALLALTFAFAASKDREVVLQPILSRPTVISSAGVTNDYLEAVTRDTAYLILNRSPDGLEYWMTNVLKLVAPEAYGTIKAQLVRIVNEQANSDIAQSFLPTKMTVDPRSLTSEVSGELRTFVGDQVISSEKKTYHFAWRYTGVSLALIRFGAVVPQTPAEAR